MSVTRSTPGVEDAFKHRDGLVSRRGVRQSVEQYAKASVRLRYQIAPVL